jgi:hypothetical protein
MPPGGNSATARPSILYVHTARALVGAVPRSERNGVPQLGPDLVGSSLNHRPKSSLFGYNRQSGGIDSMGAVSSWQEVIWLLYDRGIAFLENDPAACQLAIGVEGRGSI